MVAQFGDVVAQWVDVVAEWGDVVAEWGDVVAQLGDVVAQWGDVVAQWGDGSSIVALQTAGEAIRCILVFCTYFWGSQPRVDISTRTKLPISRYKSKIKKTQPISVS